MPNGRFRRVLAGCLRRAGKTARDSRCSRRRPGVQLEEQIRCVEYAGIIPRAARLEIESALARQAAVAMIGSRQSGKTALALDIADGMSAISLDLLRQSGETLAGRIAYVNLTPITALEFGSGAAARDRLWLRGGLRLPSRNASAMRSATFSRSAASSSTLAMTGFPSTRMSR